MFCREVIVFKLYLHKPGSRERGPDLGRVAESLNAISEPLFILDQRGLRYNEKLLKLFVEKKNREEKESGIEKEH